MLEQLFITESGLMVYSEELYQEYTSVEGIRHNMVINVTRKLRAKLKAWYYVLDSTNVSSTLTL